MRNLANGKNISYLGEDKQPKGKKAIFEDNNHSRGDLYKKDDDQSVSDPHL
jgi:hypothetical protein